MPILAGDLKLVASQVMDDVPEGGGAPTGLVIADGVSNAIFNDISELDRAGGRVNMRKLHMHVQTDDVDTFLGSNIIVAAPPEDPKVSITLFTTSDTFDRRDAASGRVESYLNRGPLWGGILFGDHIAGQRSIQFMQRVNSEIPTVGQTLVLVQNEKLSNEVIQYVRTTAVEYEERTFFNPATGKEYQAWIVTNSISDALRTDFKGTEDNQSISASATAAKLRDTVVADAGTYVGVVPLTTAAELGDFTVEVGSVYSQLVPSAQTEVPITDVRTNGLSAALVPTGGAITQTLSMGFTTSTSMFVGGPIYPGSLTVTRDGVSVTDEGGLLISAAVEVGQVDYDNGILKLSTNVWGASAGSHVVTFTPATVPDLISDQRAIRVTAESRALNYTFVMDDIPVRRTLNLSYLAQGRWYVLRDNGAGVLAGSTSAFGIGTVNYTTGSVSVTLGALPDVGSSIIVQSYSKVTTVALSNAISVSNERFYVPFNTNGDLSEEPGATSITPGTLVVTWTDGGTKTATDNGTGQLAGDATGTIDYGNGVVRISPNVLPPPGTSFLTSSSKPPASSAVGIPLNGGNLGAVNITPGSVRIAAPGRITYALTSSGYTLSFDTREVTLTITDDGSGNLFAATGADSFLIGTVNYATGALAGAISGTLLKADIAGPIATYHTGMGMSYQYPWGLVGGNRYWAIITPNLTASFSGEAPATTGISVLVNQYLTRVVMVPNYTLKGVSFTLGGTRYQQLTDGTLLGGVDPTTGGGTPVGSVSGSLGAVFLNYWTPGASSQYTNGRGLIAPPTIGVEAPFTAFSSTFRTASSPLRPSSLSVLGTMQDGTSFNVTADSNGKINGTRVKGRVDYQYGLVELYFVNPNGAVELNTDLSFLQIAGLTTIPADLVMLNSLRYNAVAFSYLPLDADLLGIDPVRLPSDGRVPIFRAGGFAVVGHTAAITTTVANAQVIDCARVRLSRVRVLGFNGAVINTGYTADLETGLVTFTDVSGYSQPVTLEHRIEDMAVVREVQISGEVTFTRALTHNYPVGSFLSSALVPGDLKSRVSVLFDQQTWNGTTWLDALSGAAATGTYNDVLAPIVVTNKGAVTERWSLVFTNTTTFNIVGEHVGVIGTGSINSNLSPLNPATGMPYFTVPALGWGIGWATGNILRFNTVGAMSPVWVVRTVQQGPNTGIQHSFTLLSRGDVDRA